MRATKSFSGWAGCSLAVSKFRSVASVCSCRSERDCGPGPSRSGRAGRRALELVPRVHTLHRAAAGPSDTTAPQSFVCSCKTRAACLLAVLILLAVGYPSPGAQAGEATNLTERLLQAWI